jgi:hypothetical protein
VAAAEVASQLSSMVELGHHLSTNNKAVLEVVDTL